MAIIKQFEVFNLRLALGCTLIAFSSFNYGFDNQAFATSQAMDAFARAFGDRNARTGKYALNPAWLSLFNSLNYIGFAAGMSLDSHLPHRTNPRRCLDRQLDRKQVRPTMVHVHHEHLRSRNSDNRGHFIQPRPHHGCENLEL